MLSEDLEIICICSPQWLFPSSSSQFTTNAVINAGVKQERGWVFWIYLLLFGIILLLFYFSPNYFRCLRGQKKKRFKLVSINDTSFRDELLLKLNNNILHWQTLPSNNKPLKKTLKKLEKKKTIWSKNFPFQCNVKFCKFDILPILLKYL